jgi:hypothetical protein
MHIFWCVCAPASDICWYMIPISNTTFILVLSPLFSRLRMLCCLVAAIDWSDQTVLFGQVVGDKPYADNSGGSTVRILGSWTSSPLEVKMCVCVCVCVRARARVSNECNRISEIDVCKPSTRQSRPRSVRSAMQTGKAVNFLPWLIKLDILKRKGEMEVKFLAFLNSALVKVCDNPQIPAV